MTSALMAAVAATMLATAFLSGIFGMAGGMILMGVLLWLLPLPEAMALHGVTQIASNVSRGLLWFGFVRWRAAITFLTGCMIAFAIWSAWRYVPSSAVAFLLLGVSPFLVRFAPAQLKPDPESFAHGLAYGAGAMTLMLLAGVSGPLIDTFFLGGKLDRREIVATKAICQIVSHGAKFAYFGGMIERAAGIDPTMAAIAIAATLIGTTLAGPVLARLSDTQYRKWANLIITGIAAAYLAVGGYLLLG